MSLIVAILFFLISSVAPAQSAAVTTPEIGHTFFNENAAPRSLSNSPSVYPDTGATQGEDHPLPGQVDAQPVQLEDAYGFENCQIACGNNANCVGQCLTQVSRP